MSSDTEALSLPEHLTALLQNVQGQLGLQTSERVIERVIRLLKCITPRITEGDSPEELALDIEVVRSLCAEGVPDEFPALRAVMWKLLLGFLPVHVHKWDACLATSRSDYARNVQRVCAWLDEPFDADAVGAPPQQQSRRTLSPQQVMEQITKDVIRTRPELDFFARNVHGMENGRTEVRRLAEVPTLDITNPRCHYDAFGRILAVYAMLNPDLRYVQGMNEVCAPIYYIFSLDPVNAAHAEADTFACFNLLMFQRRDMFTTALDCTETGLMGVTSQMSELLHDIDEEVWQHLKTQGVAPVFYAVRWITLMLAQELEMADVLKVWDSLLSDSVGPSALLNYLCVAMIIQMRTFLLGGDFATCADLLQKGPPGGLSVDESLLLARQLRAEEVQIAPSEQSESPSLGARFSLRRGQFIKLLKRVSGT